MERKEIKDRLREAMERRGFRAVDLVERTGIPKGTISYYLTGHTKPKADRLYLLARALDVSEAWLLGYDVPMARSPESKRNDQLAKLIVRLRTDSSFYEAVAALDRLNETQYRGVSQLLATMNEQP